MNYSKELPSLIFFGTPEFARYCLEVLFEAGFPIKTIVTAPDRKAGRGKKLSISEVKVFATKNEISILQPKNLKDPNFIFQLKKLKPDIQVVVAFRMLPKLVWEIPQYGTLNLHASLLPNYRGAAPINWVLINGETKTGLTTFFINEQIDTGSILLQEELTIGKSDNVGILHDALLKLGAPLIIKTIKCIFSNTIKSKPQIQSGKEKEAPKLNPENTKIDWKDSLYDLENKIRGLSPYPGAWSFFVNHDSKDRLKIFEAQAIKEKHEYSLHQILVQDGKILITTKEGYLNCIQIQLPNKKRMLAKALLNGYNFDKNASVL
jgi:methionyl-tRNA formyltransferase